MENQILKMAETLAELQLKIARLETRIIELEVDMKIIQADIILNKQ